jgi:hydrogenase expression/formation protein HypD
MSLHVAKYWLDKIHQLEVPGKIKIMNVCGGHERTISSAGIRSLLPANIELVPGPGCPVCICPEEDIFLAIQLAIHEDVILLAFGDMLRVPVNVPKKEARSLEQARARGADVRPIASPIEALNIARNHPDKKIIFFAAGFETTIAPVAAMVAEGLPDNLFILLSGRRTWPAVAMLLQSGQPGFDALIAPGHVSTVMGPGEWQFVVKHHHIPVAIAGFDQESMLAALYSVLRQKLEDRIFLDNCYQEVVQEDGNLTARHFLDSIMTVSDSNWRGVGIIRASGFRLRPEYAGHDASLQFKDYSGDSRRRIGEMPAGCDCAKVVLGKIYPHQCRLYGTACLPETPVGPCMVSDEGACHIWWNTHRRYSQSNNTQDLVPESEIAPV